ncbi:formyltransferase family protein [Mesorhizobium sp. M1252]|uniref:formyltransferase family protein n=1 Tax=Mesorhizobium sp. M1252 TaxID=2957073 RepID=UPI003338451B
MQPELAADPEASLSAVFVSEISSLTAPMLAAWIEKGHRIAAVVVPGPRPGKQSSFSTWRRRQRRRPILARYLGHRHPPLIEFGPPYDWAELGRQLGALEADLLICFGFRGLIPQTVLRLFLRGGLNLHPALLPQYRGPHPIHRLVIDGKHEIHGGVTLHKMTPAFDQGDILAQVALSIEDWHSAATVSAAIARAMARLVADAAPEHCRGRLTGMPQPSGEYVWAQLERSPLIVGGESSSDHVARLCRIIGPSVAVNVLVNGKPVRLAQPILRPRPVTGKASMQRWGVVAFDCADGRVVHLAYNRLTRLLMQLQRKLGSVGQRRPALPIRKFGSTD